MNILDPIQIFVKRLSKKERILFYIAVIFVSLALLVRVIIYPAFGKMSSLNENIEDMKLLIEKNKRFLSHRDEIASLSSQLASYLGEEGSPEEELTLFLELIDNIADESEVHLLSRTPEGFKTEELKKIYSIRLRCEGTMRQIVEFIYNIENSQKLLNVDRYIITPKEEGSTTADCRMFVSKVSIP